MTYEQAVDYFHSIPRRKRLHSLETMGRLMELLGNPQDRLPCIHVGGTNGKGSTATFCANMLSAAGYRTGLFTSPYVTDFRERFCCDGQMIPKKQLVLCAEQVKWADELLRAQGIPISEFEAVTAAGFLWFSQCCDILCLEVGMGGAHDATNIASRTLVSVLTSVSLDHTQYLGDTVEQIAREKAGIIKPGSVCVCYPKLDPAALAVCREACAAQGASLIQASPAQVEFLYLGPEGSRFRYDGEEYELSLAGRHQVYNAVNAIEAVRAAGGQGFPVSLRDMRRGLKETRVPARFQQVWEHPPVYLDGAHNPEGLQGLAETVGGLGASSVTAILGMMGDKDCQGGAAAIAGAADQVFCVPVQYPRALSSHDLWEIVRQYQPRGMACKSLSQAVEMAFEALPPDGAVVVCGSFFLAEEAEEYFRDRRLEEG